MNEINISIPILFVPSLENAIRAVKRRGFAINIKKQVDAGTNIEITIEAEQPLSFFHLGKSYSHQLSVL